MKNAFSPLSQADVLEDDGDYNEPLRPRTSVRRYHPDVQVPRTTQATQARHLLGDNYVPRASRQGQPSTRPPMHSVRPLAVPDDLDACTSGDDEFAGWYAPAKSQRALVRRTEDIPTRRVLPWGKMLVTASAVCGVLWFLGTSGMSWLDTHVLDPSTYGPLHGSVATGVFGGGDSVGRPTRLIGMNTNGQVAVLVMTADDPAHTHILIGPNLVASGFPNPGTAEVELRVRQRDGRQVVEVTIWSDTYTTPFVGRYHVSYTLVSDGKGNFQEVQ